MVDCHHENADPESWCWASQVIDNLPALKKLADTGPGPIDPDRSAHHQQSILRAARIGAAKHRIDALDALTQLTNGRPWIPATC